MGVEKFRSFQRGCSGIGSPLGSEQKVTGWHLICCRDGDD